MTNNQENKIQQIIGEIPQIAFESTNSIADYLMDHNGRLQDITTVLGVPVHREDFETIFNRIKDVGAFLFPSYSGILFGRRSFLETSLKAGVYIGAAGALTKILTACATIDSSRDWSQIPTSEFNLKDFDRWYKWNRLYNGRNKNLERPHFQYERNIDCLNSSHAATPGVSYTVPTGEVMVAAAPGYALSSRTLNTGRAGGELVEIVHGGPYRTLYAHLYKVFCEPGEIKRGDLVGNVTEHKKFAKLLVTVSGNHTDPDFYGIYNGYMDYQEDVNISDEHIKHKGSDWFGWSSDSEIYMKHYSLVYDLINKCKVVDPVSMDRIHRRYRDGRRAQWTKLDQFKYFETLYGAKPEFFPNLSQDEFQSIKRQFKKTQTLFLTLPLVKGGMRKY